jgi:hypothetical protein
VARRTRAERRLVAHLKEQFGEHLGAVVEFSQRFIEQLRQGSLFGIDWGLARSVKSEEN